MEKIEFKDLGIWLKIPIVISWVIGIIYLFIFLIGFASGVAN